MALLQTINPSTAAVPAKELLDAVKAKLGLVPNMAKVMANSPAVLKSYLDFSGDLAAGTLDVKLREQIALVTAQTNECNYCLAAHVTIGKMVGLNESQVEASREGQGSDARTTAALQFAKELATSKGHVSGSALGQVRAAGFSDGEIAEIVANVALNIFTNLFNSATQPEIDFPKVSLARTA